MNMNALNALLALSPLDIKGLSVPLSTLLALVDTREMNASHAPALRNAAAAFHTLAEKEAREADRLEEALKAAQRRASALRGAQEAYDALAEKIAPPAPDLPPSLIELVPPPATTPAQAPPPPVRRSTARGEDRQRALISWSRRIRHALIEKNLSAGRLAEIVGVHPGTAQAWAAGRAQPRARYHKKLVEALGVRPPRILNGARRDSQ